MKAAAPKKTKKVRKMIRRKQWASEWKKQKFLQSRKILTGYENNPCSGYPKNITVVGDFNALFKEYTFGDCNFFIYLVKTKEYLRAFEKAQERYVPVKAVPGYLYCLDTSFRLVCKRWISSFRDKSPLKSIRLKEDDKNIAVYMTAYSCYDLPIGQRCTWVKEYLHALYKELEGKHAKK